MGYKGLEMTNQEDYIFDGTIPYNPEFDLEELKIIENKLIEYTIGNSINGLTPQEAETFLDWVTFNARNYAVRNVPESAITSSMTGQCAPTQRINIKLLKRLGLNARAFNTGDCIKNVNGIEQNEFWGSKAVRHSVSLVNIPIIDNYGNTGEYRYLLDPTFRQFCLKKNCDERKFTDSEWLGKGYVAPHPGYFMESDNLKQLGISEETAQKTEALARFIVAKGYIYLDDENAKLYGDAFVRASRSEIYKESYINMSGAEYINNFENIPMKLLEGDKSDILYTKLPSEIEEKKQGIFSKIKDLFKKIFTKNDTKALPEGKINIPTKDPYEEFRKQYEFKGEVEGINKGQVQQLDTLVKNNEIDFENEK